MSVVNTSITINDVLPNLIMDSMVIYQSYSGHHKFNVNYTIPIDCEISDEDIEMLFGEKTKIRFNWYNDTSKSSTFIGLIEGMSWSFENQYRSLRIEGFSPSILLDTYPHFRAFFEKSVDEIAKSILQDHSIQVKIDVDKQTTFVMQSQETDYQFLCRLADTHGCGFYYDGESFFFNDIFNNENQVIDMYSKDIQFLEASINLCPLYYQIKAYDYIKDDHIEFNSPTRYGSNNPLVKTVIEKSNVFNKGSVSINSFQSSTQYLEDLERQLVTKQTNKLVTIQAKSSIPNLRIGSRIKIHQRDGEVIPGIRIEDVYIVTQISHSISGGNSYQNHFMAIPADHPFTLDMTNVKSPSCGPLSAIVKDIKDPEKLGRVKVQYLMDSNESISPWIPVLTASTKAGSFCIPQLEEKVMVFFEEFNCEKSPMVIGSFYTGNSRVENWNANQIGFSNENISFTLDIEDGSLALKGRSLEIEVEEGVKTTAHNISMKIGELFKIAAQIIELNGDQKVKVDSAKIGLNSD